VLWAEGEGASERLGKFCGAGSPGKGMDSGALKINNQHTEAGSDRRVTYVCLIYANVCFFVYGAHVDDMKQRKHTRSPNPSLESRWALCSGSPVLRVLG
jgi:hypothetical protein